MLLGMAIGDALGATVEFYSPGQIQAEWGLHQDIVGGGWLSLEAGQVTDDTQMALCLAESIYRVGGYQTSEAVRSYCQWMLTNPPDVGATISSVLNRVLQGETIDRSGQIQDHFSGGRSAGNGSLMRCWPLMAAYSGHQLEEALRADSQATHYDPLAQDACVCAGRIVQALAHSTLPIEQVFAQSVQGLDSRIEQAVNRPRNVMQDSAMEAMGFVLTSLSVACASLEGDSPEEGLIWAVNCGGDADTNGAVAGALLGARGVQWPSRWLEALLVREEIESHAKRLSEETWQAPINDRSSIVELS